MSHTPRLPLVALLLAGFTLRVVMLGTQSLWYDEGVTAWLAGQSPTALIRWTANDIQPPLYYLLTAGWARAAGVSEFSLRFVSVLASTLLIPLFYALLRPWAGVRPALWGAGLAAFHPALIYYAQEARMYALLLALGLTTAILLRPALQGAMRWRRWLAFALVGALAAYTHYFAFFLLAALAIAWLVEWRTHRRGLGRWAAAHGLIILLYAPWAAAMFERWAVDTSYWQGTLKVGEALRSVATRFTTGETMRETPATWIALLLLTATATITVHLWRSRATPRPLLRLALLWLIVPVAAVILLASTAPKFNPRYVLLALPGLLILWALALDRTTQGRGMAGRAAAVLAVVALFTPFLLATANWYFDHSFDKAQWRQVADFLRPRLSDEERVILVSGHAWPVWEYYAPDIPVVQLPEVDILDVERVLTFEETAEPLRTALADHPGAWLVEWQGEVIDPNGIVPVQLELGGREKGSSAQFNQLSLRRWSQIRSERIAENAPISVTVGADFGGQVVLEGYRPLDNGDLLLFWSRTHQSNPEADFAFALDVLDAEGTPLARVPDRRLGGYTYPSFRWQPGAIVMGRVAASEWLGAQPAVGLHTVRIGVYDMAHTAAARLPLADGSDTLTIESVQSIIE